MMQMNLSYPFCCNPETWAAEKQGKMLKARRALAYKKLFRKSILRWLYPYGDHGAPYRTVPLCFWDDWRQTHDANRGDPTGELQPSLASVRRRSDCPTNTSHFGHVCLSIRVTHQRFRDSSSLRKTRPILTAGRRRKPPQSRAAHAALLLCSYSHVCLVLHWQCSQ
jgi:hypothetical protein